MRGDNERCDNCALGILIPLGQGVSCRGAPPSVVIVPGQGIAAAFPVVPVGEWCGFWRAQPEEKPGVLHG